MNKIKVKGETSSKVIKLDEDTIIFYEDSNLNVKYEIINDIKLFICVQNSKIDSIYNIKSNFTLNIFSVDSSLSLNLDLDKDDIHFNYSYSTINLNDNNYEIRINHNYRNQFSKVINHGINLDNNLKFSINTIISDKSVETRATQDSKIILVNDGVGRIDPNLIIDNDNIEVSHSAYVGDFKEEELFYIKSRGISLNEARKLLAKAFLIGNMNLSYEWINIILEKLNMYWR